MKKFDKIQAAMAAKLKRARTDAEMADVHNMANEINRNMKPVSKIIIIDGKEYTVQLTGEAARLAGPERVRISHNPNSTPLGDIFPAVFAQLQRSLVTEPLGA